MGKGGDSGPSQAVSSGLSSNSTALESIATQQNANAQQLFGESNPGFIKAEDFYSALSSGDPGAIAKAISPATQQITQSADAAKANILRSGTPGGEKNLALEQVDVNRGAQVGSTATQGYLGSFNALAQLAGQGTNASIASAGTGISGLSSSSQSLSSLGGMQLQAQQIQAEEKGSMLSAIADLGSAGISKI